MLGLQVGKFGSAITIPPGEGQKIIWAFNLLMNRGAISFLFNREETQRNK
jgi:hypothetical protein